MGNMAKRSRNALVVGGVMLAVPFSPIVAALAVGEFEFLLLQLVRVRSRLHIVLVTCRNNVNKDFVTFKPLKYKTQLILLFLADVHLSKFVSILKSWNLYIVLLWL